MAPSTLRQPKGILHAFTCSVALSRKLVVLDQAPLLPAANRTRTVHVDIAGSTSDILPTLPVPSSVVLDEAPEARTPRTKPYKLGIQLR